MAFSVTVVSLTGPFHTTGLSGPQHTFEMDARDDFIEDGECHSNNSQEHEEQDSTSGELQGFKGNSRLLSVNLFIYLLTAHKILKTQEDNSDCSVQCRDLKKKRIAK